MLKLSPDFDYLIAALKAGYLPHSSVLGPAASQLDIVLDSVLVAGVQIVGARNLADVRLGSKDWNADASYNPLWRVMEDRLSDQLRERCSLPDAQFFFARVSADNRRPDFQRVSARVRDQEVIAFARFRAIDEFKRSDIVAMQFNPYIADAGSVTIRITDQNGQVLREEFRWCLRKPNRIAGQPNIVARAVARSSNSEEWQWEDLEPGTWQLICNRPVFAMLRPAGRPLEVTVTPGSSQFLEYVAPVLPSTEFVLDVVDQFGRTVQNYEAALRFKKLGVLIYRLFRRICGCLPARVTARACDTRQSR